MVHTVQGGFISSSLLPASRRRKTNESVQLKAVGSVDTCNHDALPVCIIERRYILCVYIVHSVQTMIDSGRSLGGVGNGAICPVGVTIDDPG